MLVSQLSAMQPDHRLVLDRGNPVHWLFALLLQQQRAFCIRLKLDYLKWPPKSRQQFKLCGSVKG